MTKLDAQSRSGRLSADISRGSDPGPRPVTWRAMLEDVTSAIESLLPEVAVRGERAAPRFRVCAGENLVGYVPARICLEPTGTSH